MPLKLPVDNTPTYLQADLHFLSLTYTVTCRGLMASTHDGDIEVPIAAFVRTRFEKDSCRTSMDFELCVAD